MIVTKQDPGTYLVTSRTVEEYEYLVDLTDPDKPECGCPGFLDFGITDSDHPCAHIEAAISFRAGQKIERKAGGSPCAFLRCKTV